MQQGAQLGGALGAEHRLELGLRLNPSLDSGAQGLGAGLGHPQFLAAAVGASFHHGDEAITLQRQDVASERCSIHHEVGSKSVDAHRPQAFQLCQDGELGRAQPARCQVLVVELGDVSGRLADG